MSIQLLLFLFVFVGCGLVSVCLVLAIVILRRRQIGWLKLKKRGLTLRLCQTLPVSLRAVCHVKKKDTNKKWQLLTKPIFCGDSGKILPCSKSPLVEGICSLESFNNPKNKAS